MLSGIKKQSLALGAFTAWLRLDKGLSEKTIHSYKSDIEQFFRFLEQKKIQMKSVKEKTLIFFLDKLRESGISDNSLKRKISSLRSFYYFQETQGEIHNPSTFIKNPKKGRKLPRYLSEENILALFKVIPFKSLQEKQEYLMLLLLYSCGLRISELLSLKLSQVDQKKAILRIRGKGGKERLIPYPKEIQTHMSHYVKDIWPQLNVGLEESRLFVRRAKSGVKPIKRQQFWYRIKQLAKKAGIEQSLSPHMLRHSFASQLLKNGMNLRVLQKLLGHSSISTTQIYTHIEEDRLRQGHRKFHPRK